MADVQSRYGIMEELNNRKINEKEKLANIERETDNKVYETDKAIETLRKQVKDKESTYVREHKDWKREKMLRLDLVKSDSKRQVDQLETEIKTRDESYVGDFKKWKEAQEHSISDTEDALKRYKEVQNTKIKEKKEIIAEIEKGIDSIKEVSREHKTE